ncbi:MAG: STAS domain-containing protein [Nitrospiraceae bacterium]|nr:STAS domain-containing protein [Nitrospiraceae bacterium]
MKVEITVQKIGVGHLVVLKGDVDMNSSPDVRGSIAEVFKQGPGAKALVIDLSGVRYMDSSGIATLVEAMQNCMKQGMKLRLAELSPSVRDVFELARLSSIFEIFPKASDAQAGL